MAHDKSKKDEIRRLYVFEQLSLANCAILMAVSYQTAQRWKRQAKKAGDDWDRVKSAHTMAGGELEDIARQILTDFVLQFKATMEMVKHDDIDAKTRVELLTSLSDSYNKAISANRKLMPETSKLAIALQVLEKLANFIKETKPDLLMAFMEVLQPFGERLEKDLK